MPDSTKKKEKPFIGITLGDVNGIGPEVILKSLRDNRILKHFTPIIYGSGKVISFYRKALGMDNFNYQQIESIEKAIPKKLNVINVWKESIEIEPGEANQTGGTYAIKSLEAAVKDLKEGKIHAITTAPLSKELVQSEDFQFPGHTEYLTEEAGTKESLMFLVDKGLRVGVATGHIPLKEIGTALTKEKIISKLTLMVESLQKDFGIRKPKIAVLGVNPHAGENGLLGSEEEEVIIPAVQELKKHNHLIMGPYPSDGFFGQGSYKNFDGILAMYHDQGLIPFKTLAFEEGVNYTAGLPFVRTSPDHGTAFGIAAKYEADETSFRNALYLANDIVHHRHPELFDKD